MQPEIWIGIVQISFANPDAPTVMQPAFTVVTTWACNSEEFRKKCSEMLESYAWKLLSVDQADPLPDDGVFSDELKDMLERTRCNPDAIIYGTLHTYPLM